MEEKPTHLDNKWTGHLCNVSDDFKRTTRPEPPLDAVIHCPYKTGLPLSCLLSPFSFLSLPLPFNGPPNTFDPKANFSIRKAFVVLLCTLNATKERIGD